VKTPKFHDLTSHRSGGNTVPVKGGEILLAGVALAQSAFKLMPF